MGAIENVYGFPIDSTGANPYNKSWVEEKQTNNTHTRKGQYRMRKLRGQFWLYAFAAVVYMIFGRGQG